MEIKSVGKMNVRFIVEILNCTLLVNSSFGSIETREKWVREQNG